MKDLISIRSEVGGIVEFFQIKTNKLKRVLLPGGMIFVTNRQKKESAFKLGFAEPVKYALKSRLALVFHCQHGEEIEEGGEVATIYSEIEGEASVKKNKIIVTRKSTVKEYTIDKNFSVLVADGDKIKIGQPLARVVSPFYGIVKYTFAAQEGEKDRVKKVECVEVLQNAVAYEIPDEFQIKVANGAEIKSGTVIAEGVIREEGYEDLSIEKESFEEEKEEEETATEEETDESEDESRGDFSYEEEPLESEFEEEEEAGAGDDDDFPPSFKKKKGK